MNYVLNYLDKVNFSKEILDYYEGRTILITGGAGAIGSNLTMTMSVLVGEQGKVIILDNLSSVKSDDTFNVPNLSNVMFVKGDVRNEVDIKRVFKKTHR